MKEIEFRIFRTLRDKQMSLEEDIEEFFATFLPGSEKCMVKVFQRGNMIWCRDEGTFYQKNIHKDQ